MRKHLLRGVAGLLGVAGVARPRVAGSEATPTIEAVNTGGGLYEEQHHSWSLSAATVNAGGVVMFSNPTGVPHGLEWTGTSGQPTPSCSGVPVNSAAT